MDNLTHTAVGLFLCRAGLTNWTPRATAIVLLAANIPDIDIVSAAGGSLTYLHYHRHITHALVALPVMALLAVLLVRLIGRKPVHWRGALLAASIAVASHLLLDWTNIYGIRLLLPFSSRWLRLDLTSVVDLWIWSVALLSILGPLIGRLVASEITSGTARLRSHGRGFAWFALAFIVLYNGGRWVLHARAVATLESRLYQDAEPIRVAALPNPANPFRWGGLVETRDFWAVTEVDWNREFDPTRATVFHKPEPDPAMEAARATRAFQEFLIFSQFPLWRVSPVPQPENARLVQIFDLRFGTPMAPGFMVSAVTDANRRVIETMFRFGAARPR